ncbi:MAG TPA: hypothetical protein VMX38_19040 [Verrucomicrobiae bacterium]|nr:hypothetical protein [Verrucomicrobiae bacterium]
MLRKSASFALILCLEIVLAACTRQSAAAPDPGSTLRTIPAANTSAYNRVQDMKQWRNPYLIVRADGVALLDAPDSAEIILKPDQLLPALATLPSSDWPYGRVVAATETAHSSSDQDGVAIRRNKGIVGGILQGAHVAIKWVPAT